MIHRTPFLLPILYPSLVWRIPTKQKELYVTFDDGPVTGPTEFVLEVLRKSQAKATFFCIGDNIRKHATVFQQIVSDGHAVGNHTFNHLNGWKTSNALYLDNTRQCQQEIDKYIGGKSLSPEMQVQDRTLFRPPYGRINRQQIKMLSEYKIVMWDVLSVDYNRRLSPEKCLQNTLEATRPGSIVVFHDSYKAERNLSFALPRFIDYFSEKGFVFKPLY